MDTKEILKNQLSTLPSNILSFVQDESWIEDVAEIAKKFQLTEEDSASLENEVFLVLICMEPEQDFKDNIKNELGLDQNIANWITEDIFENIFSKIRKDIELFTGTEKAKQNNIGNSFEQIIKNQTIAMMPALHASQEEADRPTRLASDLPDMPSRWAGSVASGPASDASEVAHDLPTEESGVIHNYINKPDPYREPIN